MKKITAKDKKLVLEFQQVVDSASIEIDKLIEKRIEPYEDFQKQLLRGRILGLTELRMAMKKYR
jgi:hypothetical protein